MITISLMKQHDNIVDVYLRGDNEIYAGGSIALDCLALPVETIYHGLGRWRRTIPSSPGVQTRMFYPPGDRKWADTPEVRREWRVGSDAEVHALPIVKDDIGSYALVTDTAKLWFLQATRDSDAGVIGMNGVGWWGDADYLSRIFPLSPTLTDKPLLVMSLRFDEDPGEVSVNFEQPDPPFHNAVTILFVWNERGTYTVRSSIVEAPLPDAPGDEPDGMQEAVDMVWQLLGVEPPAAGQARLLLAPHRSTNE